MEDNNIEDFPIFPINIILPDFDYRKKNLFVLGRGSVIYMDVSFILEQCFSYK